MRLRVYLAGGMQSNEQHTVGLGPPSGVLNVANVRLCIPACG